MADEPKRLVAGTTYVPVPEIKMVIYTMTVGGPADPARQNHPRIIAYGGGGGPPTASYRLRQSWWKRLWRWIKALKGTR